MNNTRISNMYLRPAKGGTCQDLAVSTTVVQLDPAQFGSVAREIVWSVETDSVRVTFDGTAPTTSHGHTLPVGASGTWSVETATAAKFLRATADAVVVASPFTD
jgi:hypothetical protein